ncbi:MAG TPA: DinB family protein [Acidobacteriota bacterium]|nr:DinB family protein [Acidobacteriota bacterium]
MPNEPQNLLDAILDSWDRNNTILVNFLRLLPVGVLETRPMQGSPSVAELLMHIHFVRLVFVFEDAPELGVTVPEREWRSERDPDRIAEVLNESARAVRDAVQRKVEASQEMKVHYDHPVLMLQHMIWHEGYHQGQMKLALKLAGHEINDDEAGLVTWDVWMDKKRD